MKTQMMTLVAASAMLASMPSDPAYSKSYDDLMNGPGMEDLLQRNPALYALKHKEKFGKLPGKIAMEPSAKTALSSHRTPTDRFTVLNAKSYDDLFATDELSELKAIDESAYNNKVTQMKLSQRSFGRAR